jgi:IS30 family transposase
MNPNQTIDNLLEKIYYNLSKSGSYLGPDKLYKVLKSKGITHIGKNKIWKWLHNQDDYSLRRAFRYSFRKARVVVSGIDGEFDMDLADVSNISNVYDGIKYLLFVIDIFSKYLWVEPLKNKTATEVVNALKTILHKGRQYNKIRSDNGKEFNNNIMKTFLKNEGIYYFTTQNSDTKANIVERVIKNY